MNNQLKNVLNQIRTIKTAYDLVTKNSGENFNVFQILGMETAEVKTHSKFLAELLSPNGSHEQGAKFLELFKEYLNINVIGDHNLIHINSQKSSVEVELPIGEVTIDRGGRIDIAISEANHFICIENKINATEQENQLLRYSNYCKDNKYDFHILFLSLDGHESITKENELIYLISYKKHIIEWLELCRKEAVDLPILREGIGQYINLIKKLTNQTTNKEMEKDLKNLISQYLDESRLIKDTYEKTVSSLIQNEVKQLKDKLGELFQVNKLLKSDRDDGLLIVLKSYEKYDLVIQVELSNDYFFFCLIEDGKRIRNQKNSLIELELNDKIKNLQTKSYAIGFSNDFRIGLDRHKYFYPENNNSEKYSVLALKIKDFFTKINS
jgi:hypothetical protein